MGGMFAVWPIGVESSSLWGSGLAHRLFEGVLDVADSSRGRESLVGIFFFFFCFVVFHRRRCLLLANLLPTSSSYSSHQSLSYISNPNDRHQMS